MKRRSGLKVRRLELMELSWSDWMDWRTMIERWR